MDFEFEVEDLGVMPYTECFEYQKQVLEDVLAGNKRSTLLWVEHPPTLTLGANFHKSNLLFSEEFYRERGIEVHVTDRGGDVTFHGPGQLVAYPIFDLNLIERDLHKWLRALEEIVIRSVAELGVEARRFPPHTGVWVEDRKVCAMGIKVRRWVSMHGLALNCDMDMTPFGLIIPCGIEGYAVTSLTQETSRKVSVSEMKPILFNNFEDVFSS